MSITIKHDIQRTLKAIENEIALVKKKTGLSLHLVKGGHEEDDGWLHVVVQPTRKGVRAYDYVEALSEIENAIKKKGFDQVLVLPALAD
jgi:hypothetical protein